MNRLILVGNGFDLTHGLKTSYREFIDDFWLSQINEIIGEEYRYEFENEYLKIESINPIFWRGGITDYDKLKYKVTSNGATLTFKNIFLKTITEKRSLQNWVDIENEYYQLLNKCSASNYLIDALNKDFVVIKDLFIDYLKKISLKINKNERIKNLIFERFYVKDFIQESQSKILFEIRQYLGTQFEKLDIQNDLSLESKIFQKTILEFQNEEMTEIEIINFLKEKIDNLNSKSSIEIFKLNPEQTLFLNFNYTDSLKTYIDIRFENLVNIHGELLNKANPVIFGFGDDVDHKYKDFENLNDNRYLENFKSIAYLQTRNYKKFLEFIDSEEYQVFIIGHSCGISDRTMLNTIFEHDNCKSIKPFYHKRDDGTDNYTDIVQNISRNFNDKKKYRDRVVNKTDCEPLT